MDEYRQLAERIREIGGTKQTPLMQGIVEGIGDDGLTCSVKFGSIVVDGIRLRASEAVNVRHILLKPKVGTPVIVGSLSGDLRELVVLQMDQVDEIVLNGGKLGGLVKIEELTDRLNAIERDLNALKKVFISGWTPVAQDGGAALKTAAVQWASQELAETQRTDYEDTTIKH